MSRRAAVTGASGFIGRALTRRLAGRGPMRGLFRSSGDEARRWRDRGDEVVFGDLSDGEALSELVEGADVVYHLAARKAKDDPDASRRVNVEGSRRLARRAAAAGAGRLVYVSTISVYAATEPSDPGATAAERSGPDDAQRITEDVRPRKIDLLNPYSATKYRGELAAREAIGPRGGCSLTVVRPTNVFGAGSEAWVLDWAERLERLPVAIGRDLPVDLVHVDDAARGLALAGEAPAGGGEVLHLGGHTVALADYLRALGEAIGRDVRRLPRPVDGLVRRAITAGHRLLEDDRMSTPLTRRVLYPCRKAGRLIGYEPEVGLGEAMEQIGRWYRRRSPDDRPSA